MCIVNRYNSNFPFPQIFNYHLVTPVCLVTFLVIRSSRPVLRHRPLYWYMCPIEYFEVRNTWLPDFCSMYCTHAECRRIDSEFRARSQTNRTISYDPAQTKHVVTAPSTGPGAEPSPHNSPTNLDNLKREEQATQFSRFPHQYIAGDRIRNWQGIEHSRQSTLTKSFAKWSSSNLLRR